MTDSRLFLVAGGGMLLGGLIAGLVLGPRVLTSPLGALVLAVGIAGGGAVLLNKVV